jgi:hypothetical protein
MTYLLVYDITVWCACGSLYFRVITNLHAGALCWWHVWTGMSSAVRSRPVAKDMSVCL